MILGRGEGTFLRKVPSPLPNLSSLPPSQRLLAGGEAVRREFVPAEDGDFSVLGEKDVCRGVKMGTAPSIFRDMDMPVFRKKKNASVSV